MEADRTDKEFDKVFRKRYESHSIVPDRSLWEGINTRLYQKKIDGNFHKVRQLKIAISAVAAILTGVIVYSLTKPSDNKPEIPIISEVPKTQSSSKNGAEQIQKLKQNNLINEDQSLDSQEGSDSNIFADSVIGRLEVYKENLAINDPSIRQVLDSISKNSVVKEPSEFQNSQASNNKDLQPVVDSILPEYFQPDNLKINEHLATVLPGSIRSATNTSVEDTMLIVVNAIKPATKISTQYEIIMPDVDPDLDQLSELALSGKQRRSTHFFIEGFVSPEISYRALFTNSNYSVPDYNIAYFNKTESPDITFSAGILGGFQITDRLILRTGAFLSRYSFKFKTEAFYLSNTSSGGNFVYTSSGPVNISLFSSDSISNESLIKSSIDFSYINIPISAELRFRYNYFLTLGLNFNMLAWQNMNWQAEDYNGDFTETTADPIDGLEFGGLSMNLGLGKEIYIARQLSLIINPSLRINLTAQNKTSPVKSYPYSWGLNAGLRYYFD